MQIVFAVIIFGVVLMTCGSLGLLVVRLASPQLRGTGWLSLAFFNAAAGAALLLVRSSPLLRVSAADTCLLASFVLLHVAVLRVLERRSIPLLRGALLLLTQLAVDTLWIDGHLSFQFRILSISILVAAQSAVTAHRLLREPQSEARAPAVFISVLLIGFGILNIGRGVLTVTIQNHLIAQRLALAAFSLYITVALGLAFGFFWMTTMTLAAEVEETASTDPLTRVFNRRVFLRWCHRELARSYRSGAPFSLLMIDLDHFKRINDTFGHQAGDDVLCAAVEKMQDSVRGIDVVCRWGGEEFAVLLPNASAEATNIVAERIRRNIARVELSPDLQQVSQQDFHLTTSIGTATYRDLTDSVADMLQRADDALYEAKRSGRNRVLVTA